MIICYYIRFQAISRFIPLLQNLFWYYYGTIHGIIMILSSNFQNNLFSLMTIFIFYRNLLDKSYFFLCLIVENINMNYYEIRFLPIFNFSEKVKINFNKDISILISVHILYCSLLFFINMYFLKILLKCHEKSV